MGNDARHKNITTCFWTEQADMIERAAVQQGMSLANYMRDRLTEAASRDLGVQNPQFPSFAKRGQNSAVFSAASILGVSPAEFRREAAEDTARALLKRHASTPPLGVLKIGSRR